MHRGTALFVVLVVLVSACSAGIEAESTTTTTLAVTTTTLAPLPTPDEIMADREVTDEERELARQAVYECIVDAGITASYDTFDIDPFVLGYEAEFNECLFPYIGLYRAESTNSDAFAVGLLGVVECTEDRTGKYYGPKTIDEIGRLTDQAHRTIDKALNDEKTIYDQCYDELHGEGELLTTRILEYRIEDGRLALRVENCGYNQSADFQENRKSVTITVYLTGDKPTSCWIRQPLRLKDPLGHRTIIDETTGEAVPEEAA